MNTTLINILRNNSTLSVIRNTLSVFVCAVVCLLVVPHNVNAASITVSGSTNSCTSGNTINVAVNGTLVTSTVCSGSTFTSPSFNANSGNMIAVYDTTLAQPIISIIRSNATSVTGLNANTGPSLRLFSQSGSITNQNLDTAHDGSAQMNKLYDNGTLTNLVASCNISIYSGTYAPGGNITTDIARCSGDIIITPNGSSSVFNLGTYSVISNNNGQSSGGVGFVSNNGGTFITTQGSVVVTNADFGYNDVQDTRTLTLKNLSVSDTINDGSSVPSINTVGNSRIILSDPLSIGSTLTVNGLDTDDRVLVSGQTITFTGSVSPVFSTAGYLYVENNTAIDSSSVLTLPLNPANSIDGGSTIGWFSIAPPGAPDLVASSDLGASSTDNATFDITPTFAITCITGATVTLYSGTTTIGTGTCSNSTVSITSAVLANGTHSITAKQTNASGSGLSTASGALSVVINTTHTIQWNSPTATGCTFGGFVFTGSPTNVNSTTVTPTTVGVHTYTVTCTNAAGSKTKTITVNL